MWLAVEPTPGPQSEFTRSATSPDKSRPEPAATGGPPSTTMSCSILSRRLRLSGNAVPSRKTTEQDESPLRCKPDLANPIHVDNDAAVDPQEPPFRQPGLDILHRFPHQVLMRAGMNVYVVVGRFDPINLRAIQKMDPAPRTDSQPHLRRLCTRSQSPSAMDCELILDNSVTTLINKSSYTTKLTPPGGHVKLREHSLEGIRVSFLVRGDL